MKTWLVSSIYPLRRQERTNDGLGEQTGILDEFFRRVLEGLEAS
jgi:hypothetical protein